ncbi:MAG: dihydrofolate reductase [Opitutae bacterium]|nr:dihydrofolate reductase [Opitutae bacterium]
MAKPLNLIVACAENRVIGRAGQLPWHIAEDVAWFHERTAGHVCVLGRICFESWPGVLREGRRAVVISSQPERIRAGALERFGPDAAQWVQVAGNVPAALALAQRLPGDIMICGGQRVFEETLPLADRLLLTLVHAEVAGDVHFPEWRHLPWREAWRREGRDANYRFTIAQLESSR